MIHGQEKKKPISEGSKDNVEYGKKHQKTKTIQKQTQVKRNKNVSQIIITQRD